MSDLLIVFYFRFCYYYLKTKVERKNEMQIKYYDIGLNLT